MHAARARRPSKVIADIRADIADAAALSVKDADGDLRAMPASFRADRASGWNRPVRSRSSRSKKPKKKTATKVTRTALHTAPKKSTSKS